MSGTITSTDQAVRTKTWRFEKFNPEDFDMRLMLIGRTGSGKSSVGNTILGFPAFKVSEQVFGSTTKACSVDMVCRKGQRIRVLDTCGMFDTDRAEEEVLAEVRKSHLLIAPGPHAFLLVVPVERFTKEHHDTLSILEKIFPNLYRHTILVIAKADNLGGEPGTWDTSLKAALYDFKGLEELVKKVSGRYILLSNKEKDPAVLEEQVHRLLDKVYDLYETNHQQYYNSDLFKKAEQAVVKGQNAIINNIKKDRREEDLARSAVAMMLARKVMKTDLREVMEDAPIEDAGRLAFISDIESGRANDALKNLSLSSLAAFLSQIKNSTN